MFESNASDVRALSILAFRGSSSLALRELIVGKHTVNRNRFDANSQLISHPSLNLLGFPSASNLSKQ